MTRLFKLAWRDIWRNRRRTFLTMGAILFAVLLISLASSVQSGTYDAMEELLVRMYSGDVQIHREGFHAEQTLSYSMEEDEIDWASLKARYPWASAASRRVTGFGLASSDSSSAGAIIVGIEPEAEREISIFASTPSEGQPLTGNRGAVLVGEMLAQNLGVTIGDSIVVLTQGYRNVMGAELYAVTGLLRTGSPDIDRSMLVMSLVDAQRLLAMEGRITQLVIRTDDFRKAVSYAGVLHADLEDSDVEIMSWRAMMPELEQMRTLDDAGNYVFYFFLVLIIAFEIFNTTTMSMMERVREFGVMMSVGMKPHQISILVALGLALKVLLALLAGLVLASLALGYLAQNPIPLPENMQEMYQDFGFSMDSVSFSTNPKIFVFPTVSVTAAALLSMVYPILRMRRFSPVEALRKT